MTFLELYIDNKLVATEELFVPSYAKFKDTKIRSDMKETYVKIYRTRMIKSWFLKETQKYYEIFLIIK